MEEGLTQRHLLAHVEHCTDWITHNRLLCHQRLRPTTAMMNSCISKSIKKLEIIFLVLSFFLDRKDFKKVPQSSFKAGIIVKQKHVSVCTCCCFDHILCYKQMRTCSFT